MSKRQVIDKGRKEAAEDPVAGLKYGADIENHPGCPDDMRSGLLIADEFVNKLFSQVDEAITVIETVKKIPDFNANLSVELAMSCAGMQNFASDPREDEKYLSEDDEPVSWKLL